MARVSVKSRIKEFQEFLGAASDEAIKTVGNTFLENLRQALSVPGSRNNPSQPGEPPRMRTGRGRDACRHDHKDGISRIGFGKARHLWAHECGIPYKKKGLQRRQSLIPVWTKMKKWLGKDWAKITKRGLARTKA